MKKTFLILFACLLLIGCNKKTDVINNEANEVVNESESLDENGRIKMKVGDDDIDVSDYTAKLTEALLNKGVEIYMQKSYSTYSKRNGAYFISLSELEKGYNFDISIFKGQDGTVCDIDNSGIFIDVDYKIIDKEKMKNAPPVIPTLIGCSKGELKNTR